MHQPLGHRRLVAQCGQIPALRNHHLADPAVGQQPAIGIRGVGKPIQQPGQQNRLHAAAPAALVDQRGEVGQRAVRSFVAEGGELALRGRRRHPLRELQPFWRKRFQQRLVEQLRMQPRHPHVVALQFAPQHAQPVAAAVGSHMGRPRQPAQRLVVVRRRQHVGAFEALQLKSMFHKAKELVGGGQIRRVVAADVTAGPQGGQRVDRRSDMQRLVGATVHEL